MSSEPHRTGPARRPPRALTLVRDPAPEELATPIDWTPWHLASADDEGQTPLCGLLVETLRSSLEVHLSTLGRNSTFVGVDPFFAWVEQDPLVRISPDLYTLREPPREPWPRIFETWRGHPPPEFALELVTDAWEGWERQAEDLPAKYTLLGTRELVVVDVEAAAGGAAAPRIPLEVYRREADGAFVRIYRGPGLARLETIDAWLVVRKAGPHDGFLRLARDAAGTDIVPTEGEHSLAEKRRGDEEKQRGDEEKRRADEEKRRGDEEKRRGDAETRRADELAAERARLRARGGG